MMGGISVSCDPPGAAAASLSAVYPAAAAGVIPGSEDAAISSAAVEKERALPANSWFCAARVVSGWSSLTEGRGCFQRGSGSIRTDAREDLRREIDAM
jgi:hypothetical protein